MAILATAAFACWKARKYPYLIVGLAWYLITLLPVIGILQIGWHSMADRYTYIPLIGIFIMAAWGMNDLVEGRPWGKAALAVTAGGILGALMILTWVQAGHWRDSVRLFEYVVKASPGNALAHNNLGSAYQDEGLMKEAIAQYERAAAAGPNDGALDVLADRYMEEGRYEEAVQTYRKLIALNPRKPSHHEALGYAYERQGKTGAAIEAYQASLKYDPENAEVLYRLGLLHERNRDYEDALQAFEKAYELNPEHVRAGNKIPRMKILLLERKMGEKQ
jgi:tetratricopeptide (TPR) repeat protein